MYIPKQKLAQLAKDLQSEIRIFYDDPKNKEKYRTWQKQRKTKVSDTL